MKYSVIIPIYKTEKTIRRCLDSLLNQNYPDAELILVNDGSPDDCGKICKEYASKYPCIRYCEKENGGVASARNLGLEIACGEYITFVDSDDFVSRDYFSVLDSNAREDCDMLIFGKAVFDGAYVLARPMQEAAAHTPEETALLLSDALQRQLLNSVWNKVFHRALLEEYAIRFDSRLPIGEDKVFVTRYAIYAKSAVFISNSLYICSVENPQSLSRKQREDLCDHILLEHKILHETAAFAPYKEIYLKAVSFSFYRSAYTVIAELYKFDYSVCKRYSAIKSICSRYGELRVKDYGSLRHRLMSLPIRWKWICMIDFLLRIKRLI